MKKVLFVTVPLREDPTDFPPIAILSMMKVLKTLPGWDSHLYNIDYLRPSLAEAAQYVTDYRPSVLAISAVVSTSYKWVKEFCDLIRAHHPQLPIILGGPLGASADLLLKNTAVDFVCISEGEYVLRKFLGELQGREPNEGMESVEGLVFLKNGELFSTGYADPISKEELYDMNYEDLGDPQQVEHYLPLVRPDDPIFGPFVDASAPAQRAMMLSCSKGCVAKCTFCHRWDKGIRYIPVGILMSRIKHHKKEYNVGFVRMSDENFGTDRKWLKEFCTEIAKLNIVWEVSGMRVNCVSDLQLKEMKEAGCVRCIFGMETGSKKMLEVMNKGVKLEDNYTALKLITKHGMGTTVQLVLGMPGETTPTIRETAEFVRYGVRLSENKSPFDISMNYAQALPGTPLYEYARAQGLISPSSGSEEDYMLWISDQNAANENFVIEGLSGQPKLRVLSWRPYLVAAAGDAFISQFGRKQYDSFLNDETGVQLPSSRAGYFNYPKEDRSFKAFGRGANNFITLFIKHPLKVWPQLFFRSSFALYSFVLAREIKRQGLQAAFILIKDLILFEIKNAGEGSKGVLAGYGENSLRKIMAKSENQAPEPSVVMKMLRAGRW